MVLRELRSHFLGDGIEGIVGVGFLHVEENNGNPAQQVTAPVEGFDGVGKGRRFGVAGNGLDFRSVLRHSFREGRKIMGIQDLVEWRHLIGGVILFKKRVHHLGYGLFFAARDQYPRHGNG